MKLFVLTYFFGDKGNDPNKVNGLLGMGYGDLSLWSQRRDISLGQFSHLLSKPNSFSTTIPSYVPSVWQRRYPTAQPSINTTNPNHLHSWLLLDPARHQRGQYSVTHRSNSVRTQTRWKWWVRHRFWCNNFLHSLIGIQFTRRICLKFYHESQSKCADCY